MSGAKDVILSRTRHALRDVPGDEKPEDVTIERGYRKEDEDSRKEIVDRFAEYVAEYKATVHRVDEAGLPKAIKEALERRGVKKLVIPPYLPKEWIPEEVEELHDLARSRLTSDGLDGGDGVLTGCALGIAQTGTIVLDAGRAQGRRALTLLPDYHLCIVKEEQVVGLMPEAIERLGDAVKSEGQAITFISGPSATSDIELERVEGVHGPRTLEVLVVQPG
ncbi:MAG: lactate utilization protein C [Rubrobacteraceae bacterium]